MQEKQVKLKLMKEVNGHTKLELEIAKIEVDKWSF